MGEIVADFLIKNDASAAGGEDKETNNKGRNAKCHENIITKKSPCENGRFWLKMVE